MKDLHKITLRGYLFSIYRRGYDDGFQEGLNIDTIREQLKCVNGLDLFAELTSTGFAKTEVMMKEFDELIEFEPSDIVPEGYWEKLTDAIRKMPMIEEQHTDIPDPDPII